MGEINFTNGLILSVLFSIAVIAFVIGFAADNDSEVVVDSDFNTLRGEYSGNLSGFRSAVDSASETFNKDNVQEATDTATSGGQFKVTASSALSTVSSTFGLAKKKLFGDDVAFGFLFTTAIAVITLMFVRYQYKTWFGKDPD